MANENGVILQEAIKTAYAPCFTKLINGDGLRYELAEFLHAINNGYNSYKFTDKESVCLAGIIENFLNL